MRHYAALRRSQSKFAYIAASEIQNPKMTKDSGAYTCKPGVLENIAEKDKLSFNSTLSEQQTIIKA